MSLENFIKFHWQIALFMKEFIFKPGLFMEFWICPILIYFDICWYIIKIYQHGQGGHGRPQLIKVVPLLSGMQKFYVFVNFTRCFWRSDSFCIVITIENARRQRDGTAKATKAPYQHRENPFSVNTVWGNTWTIELILK